MPIDVTVQHMEDAIGAARLLELADRDADGDVDSSIVDIFLDAAKSLALSYLDGETIPEPTPPALRSAIIDIAVQRLRDRKEISTESSEKAHDNAIEWLESIAAGKATLTPVPPGGTTTSPGAVLIESRERDWSRDTGKRVL